MPRHQTDRHVSADTPAEHQARITRAVEIMKDPLGYWRENSREPRSLTSGIALDEQLSGIRRTIVR